MTRSMYMDVGSDARVGVAPSGAEVGPGIAAEQRVLRYVSLAEGCTRKQLAEQLALPAATVATVVGKLIASGSLAERTPTARRNKAGRRPRLLMLAGYRPVLAVVGWNGGQLSAVIADYSGEVLVQSVSAVAPRAASVDSIVVALDAVVARLPNDATRPDWLTGVIIGVPAPFQRGAGIPASRFRYPTPEPQHGRPDFGEWLHRDPAQSLRERLGVPVLLENDANLAALGEFSAGAAVGHRDIVYLKVGERSVGGGLILSGSLYRGVTGFAGELAHIHVDDNGPLCACGGRGCLSRLLDTALIDSAQPAYEQTLTFTDLLRMAIEGEPGASRVMKDLGRIVGRRMADLCTFLNPSAVVIGGEFGPANELVAAGVREQIDLYAAPMVSAVLKTLTADLGPRAELMGAIHLARTDLPIISPT